MARTYHRAFTVGLLAVWILSLAPGAVAETKLTFQVAGEIESELSLEALEAKLPASEVRVRSSMFEGVRNYAGFPIQAVLDLAFGDRWHDPDYSHIAFIALDGYVGISELSRFNEQGGYLAFRDLDVGAGWAPVGSRQSDPGPFFLLWTGSGQTTTKGYPWPWQVASINLLRFADQYPEVVPAAVQGDDPVYQGFSLFRERCLRCHAMNQQGGRIGPDLNAPQSITAYRSERMIKSYIRAPSQYRYTHMPDHRDLTDRDLDNLYRYFLHQADNRP